MSPTEAIKKFDLGMKTEFVPFSKSRNAKEKNPSLNWLVTLTKGDREILTTNYMAGCAHCPAYESAKGNKSSIYNDNRIRTECEKGFAVQPESEHTINRNLPIVPKIEDVLYSLISDSDVIDYPTYEEWASNLGYDPDSRSGEKIYRACLEIALKLRASLGEKVLSELRKAFQDY